MSSYTDVFTGNPVQTTPTSFNSISFGSNTTLSWPIVNEDNENTTSDIMEVNATAAGLTLSLPPANQVSNGRSIIMKNLGANAFSLTDNGGNIVCTINPGQIFWIYVRSNSSINGSWGEFLYGSVTSVAQAASLAGLGLAAISTTLNVSFPITSLNSNFEIGINDRAQCLVWTGGAGTFTFDSSASYGNGWFTIIKNAGTGALAIDAADTIDGNPSTVLNPNQSCIVNCSGTALYTIGLSGGNSGSSNFTRLVLSVAGNSNIILSSAQAAFDIQEYTGALTGNINVVVPTQVARWWVYNNTNGGFNLTVKTAAGTGVQVAQGTRTILHCDGTNVVSSINTAVGTVTSIGTGTGLVGGPITTAGTVSLANTAVMAGSYGGGLGIPSFTVNSQGQLIEADDGILPGTAGNVLTSVAGLWASQAPVNPTLGKQPIFIPASALSPRTGATQAGCSSLATVAGASNQPDLDYLAFAPTVDQYAKFCVDLGKAWDAGTVTAKFIFMRGSGTSSANVVWGIRGLSVNTLETPDTNFGTPATILQAASTTLNQIVISAETSACTLSSPSTPTKGNMNWFEIYRNGANASDTMTADSAWLIGVLLYITVNAANDA